MENKNCVVCGKVFKPKNTVQQCCSTVCANKKAHETTKRYNHCVICGKPFWKPNAHRFKYCSRECQNIDLTKRHPKKEKVKSTAYLRSCQWCGKEFSTPYPNKKYCSEDCCYQGNLRDKREQWATEYVPRTLVCKECGSEFVTECGKPRSVFCCQSCADKYERRQEHLTVRHKKYTREARKKRDHQLREQFVSDVSYEDLYERDQGICQICGLPVHPYKGCDNSWDGTIDHIIPLSVGGKHCMENCQLSHRICNSLKGQANTEFAIDWNAKATENNYWRIKYNNYLALMSQPCDVSYGGQISGD